MEDTSLKRKEVKEAAIWNSGEMQAAHGLHCSNRVLICSGVFWCWACFQFELFADGYLHRQQLLAQPVGPWHLCRRLTLSFWLLALTWPSPFCWRQLGCEPVDGRDLSLLTFQTTKINQSPFQIKKWKLGKGISFGM